MSKKKIAAQARDVLADDRFKQMFQDSEFAIDKKSDAYAALRPTPSSRARNPHMPQDSEDDEPAAPAEPVVNKGKSLNNLFAGREDDSDVGSAEGSGDELGEGDNFQKKISRDDKKKQKGTKKDKIIKNYGNLNLK